jgi:hypothetical protein
VDGTFAAASPWRQGVACRLFCTAATADDKARSSAPLSSFAAPAHRLSCADDEVRATGGAGGTDGSCTTPVKLRVRVTRTASSSTDLSVGWERGLAVRTSRSAKCIHARRDATHGGEDVASCAAWCAGRETCRRGRGGAAPFDIVSSDNGGRDIGACGERLQSLLFMLL